MLYLVSSPALQLHVFGPLISLSHRMPRLCPFFLTFHASFTSIWTVSFAICSSSLIFFPTNLLLIPFSEIFISDSVFSPLESSTLFYLGIFFSSLHYVLVFHWTFYYSFKGFFLHFPSLLLFLDLCVFFFHVNFLLNVGHFEYYVVEHLKFFIPVKSVELCFGWQAVKFLTSQFDLLKLVYELFFRYV